MRRSRIALIAVVLLVTGALLPREAAASSGQHASLGSSKPAFSNECKVWTQVPSPGDGALLDVSGLSSADVWAVGGNGGLYAIIQHWDGNTWSLRRQDSINGSLSGVAPIAPDDVWAVGYVYGGPSVVRTFTEHWDGTRWHFVPTPSPGSNDYISGASAAGEDVWAAGDYLAQGSSTIQPLYLRWDGTTWVHIQEAPGVTHGGVVLGIDVRTSEDAWAVGYQGTEEFGLNIPLIEHWDGTAWTVVPSPQPPGGTSALNEVSAVSATDAWAVGFDSRGPLIEHWDGVSWTRVRAPGNQYILDGVETIATDDAWAVGSGASTAHWDGTRWTPYETPINRLSALFSVAALSPTDVWAVGARADGSTVTLHSQGICP